jgi:transposase-like protein
MTTTLDNVARVGRAAGGDRAGSPGPGTGAVVDRPRRAALKRLTKSVIESALAEETTEHLGYEKHDRAGIGAGNILDGTRSKTVLTECTGPVEIDVPRDRARTFERQIVKKCRTIAFLDDAVEIRQVIAPATRCS